MGARPSSFRKGGGFLNNIDGTITGYQFTDEFDGKPFVPGRDPKTKKERFHSLYCALNVRPDEAKEDVTTTLFVGGADDFEVSEDGHVLTPVEDGRELSAGTSFAKVISSLVEAGFPESNLPDDAIDYSSIIGVRCRFVQRENPDDTKRLGKRKDKKTGKEYNRQDLVIDQVYDLSAPAAKANGKAKPIAAAPKTTVTKAAGKPNGKPAVVEEDLDTLAAETLIGILADAKDNTIAKSKLSMKVLTKLMKHPQREDVRKLVFTDEFLEQANGWIYDKAAQTVALDA